MHVRLRILLGILFTSLLLLASTYLQFSRTLDPIPFRTPSGVVGTVDLSQPRRVLVGRNSSLHARVEIASLPSGANPLTLLGEFEIGMEGLRPHGQVLVNMQPGIPVELVWTFSSTRVATYEGILWLFITGGGENELLLTREILLESRLIAGISLRSIRSIFVFVATAKLLYILFWLFPRKGVRDAPQYS